MKEVPMDDMPSGKSEPETTGGATKKEVVKTLSALVADYSALIAERRKADNLRFSESVPQPTDFKKAGGYGFNDSDCEKIIAGKYTVNGKKADSTESGCIDLTYEEVKKETIPQPSKKNPPAEPTRPKFERPGCLERPALLIASGIAFIVTIVLAVVLAITFSIGEMIAAAFVPLILTVIFSVLSRGGIFALFIYPFRLPKIMKQRKEVMGEYKRQLDQHAKDADAVQVEYDAAMQEYERQVAEADKEYERKCDEQHQRVLKAIEEYIVACKKYFELKKQTEEDIERQKAIIMQRYEAIAKKIEAYPDIIPSKFVKVPEFENASCYALGKIESELKAYVDILESGRADTLKEATNCYVEDQHRRALQEKADEQRWAEEERNRILEQQADEQKRYADNQAEQAMKQTCAVSKCPHCWYNSSERYERCGMSRYQSDGHGGCTHFM